MLQINQFVEQPACQKLHCSLKISQILSMFVGVFSSSHLLLPQGAKTLCRPVDGMVTKFPFESAYSVPTFMLPLA